MTRRGLPKTGIWLIQVKSECEFARPVFFQDAGKAKVLFKFGRHFCCSKILGDQGNSPHPAPMPGGKEPLARVATLLKTPCPRGAFRKINTMMVHHVKPCKTFKPTKGPPAEIHEMVFTRAGGLKICWFPKTLKAGKISSPQRGAKTRQHPKFWNRARYALQVFAAISQVEEGGACRVGMPQSSRGTCLLVCSFSGS